MNLELSAQRLGNNKQSMSLEMACLSVRGSERPTRSPAPSAYPFLGLCVRFAANALVLIHPRGWRLTLVHLRLALGEQQPVKGRKV